MAKISFGNNDLSSKEIFEQRKRYFQVFEPHLHNTRRDVIDLWYDKLYYGKVNRFGTACYPSEKGSNLIQLAGTKEMILTLDFVASAYSDMRKVIKKSLSSGRAPQTFILKSALKPRKAWVSVHKTYHDHMTDLYDAFANTYIPQHGRDEEIVDFKSFINVFTDWVKKVTPRVPITRTGFVLSTFCQNNISGLIIEFSKDRFSDDLTKSYMLLDEAFDLYQSTAHKFGFMVDRNAPWRLIADIKSSAMKSYMEKIGLAHDDDIFEQYFYQSHYYDIVAMKKYLKSFYDSYLDTYPVIRKYYNSDCKKIHFPNKTSTMSLPTKTKVTVEQRQRIDEADYNITYGDMWWLKFYYFLRKEEAEIKMDDVQFQHAIIEAQKVYKQLDFNAALAYINNATTLVKKNNFINMGEAYKQIYSP